MKNPPFNACDYLCEKCTETEHCKVFAILRQKALSKRLNGKMADNTDAFLEDVKESLDEAIEMLEKMAEDLDIDLGAVPFEDNHDLNQFYVDKDELYQLSLTFTVKTHGFLKKIEPLIKSNTREAFDDIVWYHTIVSVKTHRAVSSDYEGMSGDAVISADVALKSLRKCIDAFRWIADRCIFASDECCILSNTALEITRQIQKRFSRGLTAMEETG
jgi:hypothetical protein